MLFNSWVFLPFLLGVLAFYYLLRQRGQNVLLLVASYVFYGAWDWRFLSLIWLSTVVDYVVGLRLASTESPRSRKTLLLTSCVVNLTLLGFFKYFNFFVDSATSSLALFGVHAPTLRLDIVLPVGISFYTFQTMSYTIDIYRGRLRPCRSFLDFALFVAFFPQLVAGPIERATHLLPQLTLPRRVRGDQLYSGAWLILWGLWKKVVVADNLAIVVDQVFNNVDEASGVACLLAVYAFAYQIYCDFSGYSDIARGIAKLMGIELMVNFAMPYLARSPAEFWHRWHISLSTWLRDYLYIPLGGSRGGAARTYRNLMLTMLLGGLWHGAAWTFVLWGGYHGALLAIHRWLRGGRATEPDTRGGLVSWLSCIGMFHLTCLGWLLFRAPTVGTVTSMLSRMWHQFRLDEATVEMIFPALAFPVGLWFVESYVRNTDRPWERPGWNWGVGPFLVTSLVLALWLVSAPAGAEFIYFQF